jgi:hypothetical protein
MSEKIEVETDDVTFLYKKKLESKLIEKFKAEFLEKVGYTPEVITFVDEKNNLPVLSLPELISIFDEIMKDEFGDKSLRGFKYRINSPLRKRSVVEYRYIYFRIARLMNHILTDIGESLENKINEAYNHATVLHGCNTCDDLVKTDVKFALSYQRVINKIRSKFKIDTHDNN